MSLTDKLRKLEAFSFCLLHISVLQGIRALEMFLFIYFTFWLHWVFAVRGLSLVVETGILVSCVRTFVHRVPYLRALEGNPEP